MSDQILHECGLAYIRLLKPIPYYHKKYGTAFYALNKLCLLMEKQHNRGQDGAGIAVVKLNTQPGQKYTHSYRQSGQNAIAAIFKEVNREVSELERMYPDAMQYPDVLKGYLKYMGEVLLGHLRYGTQGRNDVEFCHPFVKPSLKPSRHLTMAGNFNLVNTDELFEILNKPAVGVMLESDLGAMIETVHHFLSKNDDINSGKPDIALTLQQATSLFDGGYVFCGLVGNGDSFVMRDPNGIRPCHYYANDEIVVAASERATMMTAFNLPQDEVLQLEPGHALIVSSEGVFRNVEILPPGKNAACSFERIYFSRGNDPDIYRERMELGRHVVDAVLKAIDYDLENTIVSFIPNTAEVAFYGLIKGLEDHLKQIKVNRIIGGRDTLTLDELYTLIDRRVRIEKIAIKDVKIRTFITEDASRNEMVQHVYDITYGTVRAGQDTLVIIDDSIVRGTTLKESIIRMIDRLGPKRIVVVSSAPQIRYPDCYGIDMSKMGDFIAFQAAIALIKDHKMEYLLQEVYQKCKQAAEAGQLESENLVKQVYEPFSYTQVSEKIAELLRHKDVNAEVTVIYQELEGLHEACPNNTGDWYFTGNYPTPGGNRVANRAFMNYIEQSDARGY